MESKMSKTGMNSWACKTGWKSRLVKLEDLMESRQCTVGINSGPVRLNGELDEYKWNEK